MLIGTPKEIKNHEHRVGLTPASVRELTSQGHSVFIETGAGVGIGLSDVDYEKAGGEILPSANDIFAKSDMVIKVKEPQPEERAKLREGQILFTYLHLAPDLEQTQDLINSGSCCIAYETVTDNSGRLPLLAPMSEVAGRMSIQAGASCLEKYRGGRGLLLGGVPGVETGKVTIIGGGVVGRNAAQMALGMGAEVTIIDRSLDVLRQLDQQFGSRIKTMYATLDCVETYTLNADLVIGAVLIPGATAPKLINAEMVKNMALGSVIVDVAIDQGGCVETSYATTHEDPTFVVDDVVHYCVANMPGAVARTSTFALNNATLPFILQLANKGYRQALLDDRNFLNGLNVYQGKVTCKSVAENLNLDFIEPQFALSA